LGLGFVFGFKFQV